MRDPTRPDDDDWTGWSHKRRKEFVKAAGATMARAGYGSSAELEEWAKGDVLSPDARGSSASA